MQNGYGNLGFGNKPTNPGRGAHSAHILRRSTDNDVKAFRWLSPTFFDMKEAYESIIDLLCPSTCEWIQFVNEFRTWLLSDSSSILSISGSSGCGKSVLAAYIIRSLKQSPQVEGNRPSSEPRDWLITRFYKQQLGLHYWEDLYNVPEPLAYMFCDALSAEERTPSVVLSILLAQLARQSSTLLAAITKRMERSQYASAPVEDLMTIFTEDVKTSLRRYYLVIDGIDRINECVEPLLSLLSSSSDGPKLLFLSRSPEDMPDALLSQPQFAIAQGHTEHNISLMVAPLVNDLVSSRGSHLRPGIEKVFREGHKGSFLWCRVFAKYLEQQKTINLESLRIPADMFDLYTMVFESITAQPDDFKRNTVLRSLSWIAIAQRPLDISELKTALSVTEDGAEFCLDVKLQDLTTLLQEICGPLLDIQNTSVNGGAYSVILTTITLIHPTLEDFLFSPNVSTEKFALPLDRQVLHSHISKVCLAYLTLQELGNPDNSFHFQRGHATRWKPPAGEFISYAAIYVFDHIVHSGSNGAKDPRLLRALRNFITSPLQIKGWISFISASSPHPRLISKRGKPDLRHDCDAWHPGLGQFKKWLADLGPAARVAVGHEVVEWPDKLMREV